MLSLLIQNVHWTGRYFMISAADEDLYLSGSVVMYEECWDESLWTRAAGHDQWGGK